MDNIMQDIIIGIVEKDENLSGIIKDKVTKFIEGISFTAESKKAIEKAIIKQIEGNIEDYLEDAFDDVKEIFEKEVIKKMKVTFN